MSISIAGSRSTQKKEGTPSRLNPYEKLPRIGSSHQYIPRPPQYRQTTTNPRIRHFISNEKQEIILLAIRLSDGRRLEKEFSSNDQIIDLIKFVKSEQNNLGDEIYLSSGDVPKRQFKDFKLTLKQANITNRSVLFMESEDGSRVDFYRQLLSNARIFLTEVDGKSSVSVSECRSVSPLVLSKSDNSRGIDQELSSTRQRCHQRLLTCSRKKLRLLSVQEENDKRHLGFQKFIDNLDEKRCANIRRYQTELKEYLLNRLQADRLREQLHLLNQKIDQLNEEKNRYSDIIDIVQKAIPLFPEGLLQGGSDGVKSLILRYETLVQNKLHFEQRDFSKEKQERRQELQRLMLEHNTRIAKLSTRLAQCHDQLNDFQKKESIKEEKYLNEMDLQRLNNTTLSQLISSINYLYDRYRLLHQIKKGKDQTFTLKLRTIQEFVLYRIDLLERAKN